MFIVDFWFGCNLFVPVLDCGLGLFGVLFGFAIVFVAFDCLFVDADFCVDFEFDCVYCCVL